MADFFDELANRFKLDQTKASAQHDKSIQQRDMVGDKSDELWTTFKRELTRGVTAINSKISPPLTVTANQSKQDESVFILYSRAGERRQATATYAKFAHSLKVQGGDGEMREFKVTAGDARVLFTSEEGSNYTADALAGTLLQTLLE